MKKFFCIATIVALFLGVLSFVSCTPDHDQFDGFDGTALSYEFSVADQVNVNRFEIEISITGNVNGEWTTGGMLLPVEQGLIHDYALKVDVTDWFKDHSVIYSRIKTVDKDGKLTYSSIQTTYK